jgi:transposase-like protein
MKTKKKYCLGCEAKGIRKVCDEIIEHEGEHIPVCKSCKRVFLVELESIIWDKK